MNKSDLSLIEKKKISLLIYTESFLNCPQAIEYLEKTALFSEFEINYLPVLNNTIEVNVEESKYNHIRECNIIYSVIELKNASGCVGTHHRQLYQNFDYLTDSELDKLAEKIIIEGNAYAAPFDIVVVSDEWAHKNPSMETQVVSFSKAKEFIRLFMINNQKFFVTPHYHIDEFYYYIFRHKYLFENFQHFWSSTVHTLNEYNDALDNRLLQFSICLDKIKSLLWFNQNNITAMHLKYHISYLILLTTGTFDNLAWIINNYYNLGMEKKMRLSIDLKKDKFINTIMIKSSALAGFIDSDIVRHKIDAIRELRDRIVHRDFVSTISSGSTKQTRRNYLMMDVELKNKLIDAGFSQSSFPFPGDSLACANINDFVDFIADSVVYITDGLLEIINNELFGGNKKITIWKMLDFPCEPYIL